MTTETATSIQWSEDVDQAPQLQLGFGHAQFNRKNYADAERQFRDVCENFPGTDAAEGDVLGGSFTVQGDK